MKEWRIDINCDVGEGIGNEAELFPYISSCNIACGGHAGNTSTMREVAKLAMVFGLKIGAHPSYPDKANFGRVSMNLTEEALTASIREQVYALIEVLKEAKGQLYHIKAHGALYNDLARNPQLAKIYLQAVAPFKSDCALFVPFGSSLENEAQQAGFQVKAEAFADRAYLSDYSLVPRSHHGALIEDPGRVMKHLLLMIKENQVRTLDDTLLPMKAETFCIHGDTVSACQILMYLGRELPSQGIYLKK